MDILFAPLKIFVWNPVAVFVMAGIFALLFHFRGRSIRSKRILGIAAVTWFIYAQWETYMTAWRSPSGDMAIRLDMLLVGPILLIVTVAGIFTALFGSK